MLTFAIALVLVLVGIFASLVTIAAVSPYAVWFVVIGFVVLAAGVLLDGM
jgi:hypothetical protein